MLVDEDADLLPFDVDVDIDHSNLDTTVIKENSMLLPLCIESKCHAHINPVQYGCKV